MRNTTISSLLILALSACGGGDGGGLTDPGAGDPGDPNDPGGPTAESVRFTRDEFGVPHIFAETDEGAMYGLGWASAEDRFLQMSWHRWIAQGRVAEVFGFDEQHVQSDLDARVRGYARYADRAVAQLDEESSAWLQAYTRGVNAYLASGGELHPLFAQRGLPVEPWEPAHSLLVWLRLARFFTPSALDEATALVEFEALVEQVGFDEAVARSSSAQILDDSAATVSLADVPDEMLSDICAYTSAIVEAGGVTDVLCSGTSSRHMSHAWAVSGDRSATGNSLLGSDPKAGVNSPSVFYEWHVRGDSIDVRGAGPAGTYHALVGSNDRTGWGLTSVGLDQADLYRIEVDAGGHPGQYRVDGDWRDFEVDEEETILVKGGAAITTRYRETQFGPLITELLGDEFQPFQSTVEFAMYSVPFGDPSMETVQALPGIFRSGSVEDFLIGASKWSFPAINLIAADASGSIAYTLAGTVPVRSAISPLAGNVAQDGSQSATLWMGNVPPELLPHVIDPSSGHVLSANHMPVGSWYPIPLRVATGGAGDTARSRRLRELLEAQGTFTQAEMEGVHLDTVHVSRRDIVRLGLHLRDVQGGLTDSAALAALDHLEGWLAGGASMAAEHYGVACANHFDVKFRDSTAGPLIAEYGSGENGMQNFLKTAIGRVEGGGLLSANEAAYISQRLAAAFQLTIANAGGNPQGQWLTWYGREQVLPLVPWVSLEGFPTLDPNAAPISVGPVTCLDGGTILSQGNQSYSQSLALGMPELTRTLLPIGNSERGSHQTDQEAMFEAREFKAEPLAVEDLENLGLSADIVLEFEP